MPACLVRELLSLACEKSHGKLKQTIKKKEKNKAEEVFSLTVRQREREKIRNVVASEKKSYDGCCGWCCEVKEKEKKQGQQMLDAYVQRTIKIISNNKQ